MTRPTLTTKRNMKQRTPRNALAALAWLSTLLGSVAGAALPHEARVPGGVALIDVGPASGAKPSVMRGASAVWVTRQSERWVAVVGIALGTTPGAQQIDVRQADGSVRTVSFTVKPKRYPVQHVTLPNQAMVEPPPELSERLARESAHLKSVRAQWHESDDTNAAFVQPAHGRLSGRFGGSRVLNGKPRAPHAGLDVAVPTGTAVLAPGDGVVLDTGDYYFCGKTMFIDHGNGLMSLFCHLNDWEAQPGERVRQGQTVARSGGTGRASGPHLHWAVYLNGVNVEPELFLPRDKAR